MHCRKTELVPPIRPHGLDDNGPPAAGNTSFAIHCDRGPASSLGLFALGTAADPAGTDPGVGILLHVNALPPQVFALLARQSDAAGVISAALALPAHPSFCGFPLYAQGAFLWSSPCLPSVSGLSSSPGLEFRIQAP